MNVDDPRDCSIANLLHRIFHHLPIYAGPVAVVTVPPVRRRFGWVPTERIPSTFPRKL